MEFKADCLLLRGVDSGESDRLVTLLTSERGKIFAAMKGVRKAGAKLKFASRPFCFAEYVFAERGGRYTVTGASLHDGFFGLSEDILSFYAAASVTQICDRLVLEGMDGGPYLVAAVRCLSSLSEGGGADALLRFLLTVLSEAGYPVAAGECPVCGGLMEGRIAFDMARGAFTCAHCSDGVPVSGVTYRTVRSILAGGRGEGDGSLRALRLLRAYLLRQTELDLPAFVEYLRLLGGEHG